MTEQECLNKMVAPGTRRPGKFRDGVIQIHITRACDNACFGCTQGSNLGGHTTFMTPEQFEQAVLSLRGYYGVYGVFGGNPALSPHFPAYCEILRRLVPRNQRGLWCNNPNGHGKEMRKTFDPAVSNLNVHLSRAAYDEFRRDWPESRPFGLDKDSRHAPVHLAMRDVLKKDCPDSSCDNGKVVQSPFWSDGPTNDCEVCHGTGQVYFEAEAWRLISGCDINQHWSAMIGVFRGELRAWFCEVAGAQAMLHQDELGYPDTGIRIDNTRVYEHDGKAWSEWWQMKMSAFAHQVRKHCHDCGVPLRGHGELAMAEGGTEQTSATHVGVFKPKRKGREVQVVTDLVQLGVKRVGRVIDYMANAQK